MRLPPDNDPFDIELTHIPEVLWIPGIGIVDSSSPAGRALLREHFAVSSIPTPATPDELQMLADAGLDLSMFDV